MRLNLDDPRVFDRWRELYHEMTDQEHLDFANACEERFPTQVHHDRVAFDRVFTSGVIPPGARVLEVGGWKGELAAHCLSRYPIAHWRNIEFCTNAAAKTVPMPADTSYFTQSPPDFRWFSGTRHERGCWDVFVSAHTIEHFSNADLMEMIGHISGIPTVVLEAPIGMEPSPVNVWDGYLGTHILTMGWREIIEVMYGEGYAHTEITPICHVFTLREFPDAP